MYSLSGKRVFPGLQLGHRPPHHTLQASGHPTGAWAEWPQSQRTQHGPPGPAVQAWGLPKGTSAGWAATDRPVPVVTLNHNFARDSYTACSQQRQPRPQQLHCRILPKPLYKPLRNTEGKTPAGSPQVGTTPTSKPEERKPQTSTPHACRCKISKPGPEMLTRYRNTT